jgi:hypothetical protein
MAVLSLAPQAQRQGDLLAQSQFCPSVDVVPSFNILALPVENPGHVGGDRAQFPEDPFGGGEFRPSFPFLLLGGDGLVPEEPSGKGSRGSVFFPSVGGSLPQGPVVRCPQFPWGGVPWMAGTTSQTLVQGGDEGYPALLEQDGAFTVTDEQGNVLFHGDEVAAEFAYWRRVFGVPDGDVEVAE